MPAPFDCPGLEPAYLPVLRLWSLRALARCSRHPDFGHMHLVHDARVARLLGLTERHRRDLEWDGLARTLAENLARAEASRAAVPTRAVLARNVAEVATRMRLNNVEHLILHFCIVERSHAEFREILRCAGLLTRASLIQLLAECLALDPGEVKSALDDKGRLSRSAVLSVDDREPFVFESKIELLRMLPETLTLEHADSMVMLDRWLVRGPVPRLTLDDFPHLGADVAILRRYLVGACQLHQPGANVLLHGRPGTGKTEFARALATNLGLELLEIPSQAHCGRLLHGEARFDALRFAQVLLAGAENQLLLFDEVETVCGSDDGFVSGQSGRSGLVHQILQSNAVPAIWITSSFDVIDPAYRRRFDLVVQLDVPPVAVRRRLIDHHMGALALPETWRKQVARHQGLTPAIVERVARVGNLVCALEGDAPPQEVLTRVMNHTLAAQGGTPLRNAPEEEEIGFRVDLLNADCDLASLQTGLRAVGRGRLCLFGPPGTGKSAFGRHLAEALELPLLVRRASDILSPYSGEAERNIATMFEQARQASAILLLDEADSLLYERQGAQHSWEVTQVNEMLTQMESYQGIFVASTNLMGNVDQAAVRRFDVCIRFGYLSPAQAWTMFTTFAEEMGLATNETIRHRLDRLTVLTPGDFAALARGSRLSAPASAEELIGRLSRACAVKKDRQARPIGFLTGD